MAPSKQRRGGNAANVELQTLQNNVTPAVASVNGLQLVLTTPEQLREIVDAAVSKALGSGVQRTPDYLDSGELCSKLRISAPTLRKLIDEGLPFLRCGEQRRYVLATVEAWLSNRGAVGK